MSISTWPVLAPYAAPWCTSQATFALWISFLLGRQLTLGHEPPIHRRSTTAVRRPDRAICHAKSFPPAPLPRTRNSNCSVFTLISSGSCGYSPSGACAWTPVDQQDGRPSSIATHEDRVPGNLDFRRLKTPLTGRRRARLSDGVPSCRAGDGALQ